MIFREGDPGGYAFIVVSGTVEISKAVEGESSVLVRLGKGEIVGELAVFTKKPRTATARALEQSIIRILDEKDVNRELEKLSRWVGRMIIGLSKRFIDLNEKAIELDRMRR